MAALRLGAHVRRTTAGHFEILLAGGIMKTPKAVRWGLDADVAALFADYLSFARPLLLAQDEAAGREEAVWIGLDGHPLDRIGVTGVFQRRTRDWFGRAYGPHTARKWLKESATRRSPTAAFDAAEVMGHSAQVSLRHYADACNRAANARHAAALQKERQASETLARRFFEQRGLLGR
jgi:hypothetical protein